jgi:hypothetical protein
LKELLDEVAIKTIGKVKNYMIFWEKYRNKLLKESPSQTVKSECSTKINAKIQKSVIV